LKEEVLCEQVNVDYSLQAGLLINGKHYAFWHIAMQKDSEQVDVQQN